MYVRYGIFIALLICRTTDIANAQVSDDLDGRDHRL